MKRFSCKCIRIICPSSQRSIVSTTSVKLQLVHCRAVTLLKPWYKDFLSEYTFFRLVFGKYFEKNLWWSLCIIQLESYHCRVSLQICCNKLHHRRFPYNFPIDFNWFLNKLFLVFHLITVHSGTFQGFICLLRKLILKNISLIDFQSYLI